MQQIASRVTPEENDPANPRLLFSIDLNIGIRAVVGLFEAESVQKNQQR